MLDFDKLSYSIGQVSALTEVAQSTLRYWETVIARLNPFKTDGGSRRYSKEDIELILVLKNLLYEKGFTIKGANLFLEEQGQTNLPTKDDTIFTQKQNIESGNRINNSELLLALKNIQKLLER